jgi:hypothetical protein
VMSRVSPWRGERMWNNQKDCHVEATLAPRHETHTTRDRHQTERRSFGCPNTPRRGTNWPKLYLYLYSTKQSQARADV